MRQVAQNGKDPPSSDTVARFGDEFLIMINNIDDSKTIEQIADKIINVFAEEFLVESTFHCNSQCRNCYLSNDGENSETLIEMQIGDVSS